MTNGISPGKLAVKIAPAVKKPTGSSAPAIPGAGAPPPGGGAAPVNAGAPQNPGNIRVGIRASAPAVPPPAGAGAPPPGGAAPANAGAPQNPGNIRVGIRASAPAVPPPAGAGAGAPGAAPANAGTVPTKPNNIRIGIKASTPAVPNGGAVPPGGTPGAGGTTLNTKALVMGATGGTNPANPNAATNPAVPPQQTTMKTDGLAIKVEGKTASGGGVDSDDSTTTKSSPPPQVNTDGLVMRLEPIHATNDINPDGKYTITKKKKTTILEILEKMKNGVHLTADEVTIVTDKSVENIYEVSNKGDYDTALIFFFLKNKKIVQDADLSAVYGNAENDKNILKGNTRKGRTGELPAKMMRVCRKRARDIVGGDVEKGNEIKRFILEAAAQKVIKECPVSGDYLTKMRRNAIAFYGINKKMTNEVLSGLEKTSDSRKKKLIEQIDKTELELKRNRMYSARSDKVFFGELCKVAEKGVTFSPLKKAKRIKKVQGMAIMIANRYKNLLRAQKKDVSFVETLELKKRALLECRDNFYALKDGKETGYKKSDVEIELINDMINEVDLNIIKGNACMRARKEATRDLLVYEEEKTKKLVKKSLTVLGNSANELRYRGERLEELNGLLEKIPEKMKKKVIEETVLEVGKERQTAIQEHRVKMGDDDGIRHKESFRSMDDAFESIKDRHKEKRKENDTLESATDRLKKRRIFNVDDSYTVVGMRNPKNLGGGRNI
jgi:hypothetical protein